MTKRGRPSGPSFEGDRARLRQIAELQIANPEAVSLRQLQAFRLLVVADPSDQRRLRRHWGRDRQKLVAQALREREARQARAVQDFIATVHLIQRSARLFAQRFDEVVRPVVEAAAPHLNTALRFMYNLQRALESMTLRAPAQLSLPPPKQNR